MSAPGCRSSPSRFFRSRIPHSPRRAPAPSRRSTRSTYSREEFAAVRVDQHSIGFHHEERPSKHAARGRRIDRRPGRHLWFASSLRSRTTGLGREEPRDSCGVGHDRSSGPGPSGQLYGRALSQLTELSGGVALWANHPHQLGTVFGALADVLNGSAPITAVRFRIQSSIVGAFPSGGVVLGTLHYESCPWYCWSTDVPFAVRIP